MARTLETIFSRSWQLLLLPLLFLLVSLVIAYILPRSYQTTATLWALRRFEIIGMPETNSDLLSTPADTQATALSELLKARTFVLSVAKETDLASTLDANVRADPQLRDDALFDEISLHVTVLAQGSNLFEISYTNRDPQLAQQVVASVIHNYGLQSQRLSVVLDQNVLQNYQVQLTQAGEDENAAVAAESQYILTHSNVKRSDLLTDPKYALLHAQTQQAQSVVEDLQTRISFVEQAIAAHGTGVNGLFNVLDAPVESTHSVLRSKVYLIAGGIGLGVGIIACIMYIVILVRRDHAMYSALDVQRVTALPVLMQLPHLQLNPQALLEDTLNGTALLR